MMCGVHPRFFLLPIPRYPSALTPLVWLLLKLNVEQEGSNLLFSLTLHSWWHWTREAEPVRCQGALGDGGKCIAASKQGHFGTCERVCGHANHSWPVNHCQYSHVLGHSSGTNQWSIHSHTADLWAVTARHSQDGSSCKFRGVSSYGRHEKS